MQPSPSRGLRCWLVVVFLTTVIAEPASAVPIVIDLFSQEAVTDGIAIFQRSQLSHGGASNGFLTFKSGAGLLEGFNSNAKKIYRKKNQQGQFTTVDTKAKKTGALLLSSVPKVWVGDVRYREFLLDVNQSNTTPAIFLDRLQFYTIDGATVPMADQIDSLEGVRELGRLAYDLDRSSVHGNLNVRINGDKGTGKGDLFLYLPDRNFHKFGADTYLVLYSAFRGNNSGFEQWAVFSSPANPALPLEVFFLPEPSTLVLVLLAAAGCWLRRRNMA